MKENGKYSSFWFIIVVLLVALAISACQSEEEPSSPTAETSIEATPRPPTSPEPSAPATSAATVTSPSPTSTEIAPADVEPTEPRPTVTSPVPTPTPSPEPTPTPELLPDPIFYEIQEGDSLIAIADLFDVLPEELAIANGFADVTEFSIIVGQEIQIPTCQVHQVVPGNTLSSISSMCGLQLDNLVIANIDQLARLENLAAIPEGFILRIPQQSSIPADVDCLLQPERLQVIEYRPLSGEGLFCLSLKFNVSTTAIIQANVDRLTAPNVYGETSLLIPPLDGAIYIVTVQDIEAAVDLETLADWYQLPLESILDWNGNQISGSLSEGQQLYLPGATLENGIFRSEPTEESGDDS